MSQFTQGNEAALNWLTAARRHYSDPIDPHRMDSTETYMRGMFDGMLSFILIYMGVEYHLYQGVQNEIRFLHRRASESSSRFLP